MAGMAAAGGGGKGGGGGYSNQTAATSTATGTAGGGFNDSGWVVNFKSSGNAAAATSGATAMPGWVLPALAVGAVLWAIKH